MKIISKALCLLTLETVLVVAEDSSNSESLLLNDVIKESSNNNNFLRHGSTQSSSTTQAHETIRLLLSATCYDVDGYYIPNCVPTAGNKPTLKPTTAQCPATVCNYSKGLGDPRKENVNPCTAKEVAKFCSDFVANTAAKRCDATDNKCNCVGDFTTFDFKWNERTDGCYVACSGRLAGSCKHVDENTGKDKEAVCPSYGCGATIVRSRQLDLKKLGVTSCDEIWKLYVDGFQDDWKLYTNWTKTLEQVKEEVKSEANLKCNPLGQTDSCMCKGELSGDLAIVRTISDGGEYCEVEFKASLKGECAKKPVIIFKGVS